MFESNQPVVVQMESGKVEARFEGLGPRADECSVLTNDGKRHIVKLATVKATAKK